MEEKGASFEYKIHFKHNELKEMAISRTIVPIVGLFVQIWKHIKFWKAWK